MEVYCHKCFVYFEYNAQKDCPSCKVRLNNWHIAKQVKAEVKGAATHDVSPPTHG